MKTKIDKSRTTPTGRHHTKILMYYGRKVKIDEEIAPLISNMWRLGINTCGSCQAYCSFGCDHKIKHTVKNGRTHFKTIKSKRCRDNITIIFDTSRDIELFYNAVAEYSDDYNSMYANITGMCAKSRPLDAWIMKAHLDNRGVMGHWGRPKFGDKRSTCEMWIDDSCDENNFVMRPYLTFPRKHLSYVEERLALKISQTSKKIIKYNERQI